MEVGIGEDFLPVTPKAQSIQEKVHKSDFIKTKTFASVNDRKETHATDWEKRYLIHSQIPRYFHKRLNTSSLPLISQILKFSTGSPLPDMEGEKES